MSPRRRTYRLAYADFYDWLPYRTWSARRLAARARAATRAHEAVVIFDAPSLQQWREGLFASPLQLQQAQLP